MKRKLRSTNQGQKRSKIENVIPNEVWIHIFGFLIESTEEFYNIASISKWVFPLLKEEPEILKNLIFKINIKSDIAYKTRSGNKKKSLVFDKMKWVKNVWINFDAFDYTEHKIQNGIEHLLVTLGDKFDTLKNRERVLKSYFFDITISNHKITKLDISKCCCFPFKIKIPNNIQVLYTRVFHPNDINIGLCLKKIFTIHLTSYNFSNIKGSGIEIYELNQAETKYDNEPFTINTPLSISYKSMKYWDRVF